MTLAFKQAEHTNCSRRAVGAAMITMTAVVTACNGTPDFIGSCIEGNCARCANPDIQSLASYDECACVHAEAIAIAAAANMGIETMGASLYITLQPCLTCLKLIMTAGVAQLYWVDDLPMTDEAKAVWVKFASMIPDARKVDDRDFETSPLWSDSVGEDDAGEESVRAEDGRTTELRNSTEGGSEPDSRDSNGAVGGSTD